MRESKKLFELRLAYLSLISTAYDLSMEFGGSDEPDVTESLEKLQFEVASNLSDYVGVLAFGMGDGTPDEANDLFVMESQNGKRQSEGEKR